MRVQGRRGPLIRSKYGTMFWKDRQLERAPCDNAVTGCEGEIQLVELFCGRHLPVVGPLTVKRSGIQLDDTFIVIAIRHIGRVSLQTN
jgi:hypothetical protein